MVRFASRVRWSKPPRWWLSGNTDAMWLDRCGEDADRPFFHGLTEHLRLNPLSAPRPGRRLQREAAGIGLHSFEAR